MNQQYKFISFFRAIAAFWVLLSHCVVWSGSNIPVPSGKIAVDLFMIISGYLMTATMNTDDSWVRFWSRRFFRIAPAYYLSLVAAIVFSNYFLTGYQELQTLHPENWPVGGVYDPSRIDYSPTNLALHVSFLFGLFPSYSFSTFLPDWSLSLEMQFYFVFPMLLFVAHRFGFFTIAMFALVCGIAVGKFVYYPEPSLLFMKLNYFVAGMLLFRFAASKQIVPAIFATILVSIDYRRYGAQTLILPILLLAMMFLSTWSKPSSWVEYLIDNRVVNFASDTSYSVYLFHGFFISAYGLLLMQGMKLNFTLMLLFVTSLSYLTAYTVHRCVELPGIRFGKHLFEKKP